jgi:hypothetical protein
MRPIEFITDINRYNNTIGEEMYARTEQDLIITDGTKKYKVLSYYLTEKGMVLDIEVDGV